MPSHEPVVTCGSEEAAAAGEPWRVLVADDDARFRQGLLRLFHSLRARMPVEGCECETGAEAMNLLAHERVNCVLLDYQMPGGDGLVWLQRMVREHPNLAVILVTGHGDEQTAVSALKHGAMDYLVKGAITPEGFTRAITNAIEKVEMRMAIERQRRELMEAEKQRAMVQSLGAACHHLGQPATTLRCALELIGRAPALQSDIKDLVKDCIACADQIAEILQTLQRLTTFRTVPYITGRSALDSEILDIAAAGSDHPASTP